MSSITLYPGAGADDGFIYGTSGFANTDLFVRVGFAGTQRSAFVRFVGASGLSGVTVSAASVTYTNNGGSGTVTAAVADFESTANAAQVTSFADYGSRTLTGHSVSWNPTGATTDTSPDLSAAIQAICTAFNPVNFQLFHDGSAGSGTNYYQAYSFNNGSSYPSLTITYTAGGGGTTGTLAYTNANDTASASGTTTVVGTAAASNAADTSSATGTTTVVGSSTAANAADSSAASGTTTILGTAATTNANDTASASGTAGAITGTVDYTNRNDTLAASGWAGTVSGTVAYTNRNDTATASGTAGTVEAYAGGFWHAFEAEMLRRKREQRERARLEQEAQQIQDELDRAIAQEFRKQDAEQAKLTELKRLANLAQQHKAYIEREFNDRVVIAAQRATERGNYSALEALDRELRQAREEEEFLMHATMLILQ